jgi:O-acetyl-ADP-ribose deacetylase (regulator of RNase III)
MPIEVVQADITTLDVDAIVNAANERMLGGGGVDGAIHRAAGPELLAACRLVPEVRPGVRCPTGEARLTPGFRLPARSVIHTVGPVWSGGTQGEPELLSQCYRNSLEIALDHAVSLGRLPGHQLWDLRYPIEEAATIAVREVRAFLDAYDLPEYVFLVTFDETTCDVFTAKLF